MRARRDEGDAASSGGAKHGVGCERMSAEDALADARPSDDVALSCELAERVRDGLRSQGRVGDDGEGRRSRLDANERSR